MDPQLKETLDRNLYYPAPENRGQLFDAAHGSENAARLAVGEVVKATSKHPTWPTDPLHALAVLQEEVGELTKEVLQLTYEPHKSSPEAVRGEAVQTAAMALRFLMSLDAYVFQRGAQHSQNAGDEPLRERE